LNEIDKPVLVYATFPSEAAAETAGEALVAARLAACVNILPGMTSIYNWEGRTERASEVVMVIKTREGLADEVIEETRRLHPYTVPALIKIPVSGGHAPFLEWILGETASPARS